MTETTQPEPRAKPTLPQMALVVLVDDLQRRLKKQGRTHDAAFLFRMISKRYDKLIEEGQREMATRIEQEQKTKGGA